MFNRVLNSVNILYTPNIEDVQNYSKYTSPNTFVVSSYFNPGSYIGFDYYKGLSYELYYIDPDTNIQQLTYNIVEGNGLSIKDNKFEIKIDNDTLKIKEYNGKYYINVDTTSFKEASYLNRGLLSIKNDIYYNNNYFNTFNENGSVVFDNNQIKLSNGLKHDLQNIKKYYDKCNNIIKKIEDLYKVCIADLNVSMHAEVGDILYYNSEKKKYTLNKTNKSGTINTPAMVCVIASNVLEDGDPRFMPLKRNMNQYIYDSNNIMYVKNALNTIPIYSTNDTDQINIGTSIISSNKGYIAIKRDEWKNNVHNPLNSNENYYVLNDKILVSSIESETILSKQNINWYIDGSKINYNDNYKIAPNGIFTDIIDQSIQQYINGNVYMIININFNNDISKYYLCNLELKDNRLINTSYIYGYNLKKTITNNFAVASNNSSEFFEILSKKDISNNTNSQSSLILFTDLETITTDFIENSDNTETYVISKDSDILTDTKITISVKQHYNNEFHFLIQSSITGQVLLSSTSGVLNKTHLIISDPKIDYEVHLINNSTEQINSTIRADLIPDQLNKYKPSYITYQVVVAGKEKTIKTNNTIINSLNIQVSDEILTKITDGESKISLLKNIDIS